MLRHQVLSCLTIGVTVVVTSACGTDAVDPSGAATDVTSSQECQAVVDGEAYVRLLDAKSTSGIAAKAWFQKGTDGLAYSITRNQELRDDALLTVCLLEAPGIAIPQPPGGEAAPTGSQFALVILGLKDKPVLDAVGPADRVEVLFAALDEEPAAAAS